MIEPEAKEDEPIDSGRFIPFLDMSLYEDYRTLERGKRQVVLGLIALALFGFFLFVALVFSLLAMPKTGEASVSWGFVLGLGLFLFLLFVLVAGGQMFATYQLVGTSSLLAQFHRWLFWRGEEKLELDEAPAQLARQRGQYDQALKLYADWRKQHPKRDDLLYRMAEIHHWDLKNRDRALGFYRGFLRRVDERGQASSAETLGLAQLARAHVSDLENKEAKSEAEGAT